MGTGDARQQFQGEQRDALGGDFRRQPRLAKRIAVADHHLTAAIEVEIGAAGLGIGSGGPHLEHNVGGECFRPRRNNFGALVDILLIGMACRLARPGLDDHLKPCFDQCGDGGRD